jgi:hypothetical protein
MSSFFIGGGDVSIFTRKVLIGSGCMFVVLLGISRTHEANGQLPSCVTGCIYADCVGAFGGPVVYEGNACGVDNGNPIPTAFGPLHSGPTAIAGGNPTTKGGQKDGFRSSNGQPACIGGLPDGQMNTGCIKWGMVWDHQDCRDCPNGS